jgi:flagellar M-ring protein FliF
MADTLTRFRQRLMELSRGFTIGQKAMIGITLVIVLLGGFFFMSWASKPAMVPLYTDLDPADAAAVTEELNAQGVSYQLEDGGKTVLVPKREVYDLRIALSAEGLPSSGNSGYALLDEQGITASQFRQQVDYQRALQGELEMTIEAIDGVTDAKVNLVMPEEDLFTEDDQKSSASVLIATDGTVIAGETVQSVLHLVASSVEGLTPENVTISDTSGALLIAPGADGLSASINDARAQQTVAYERQTAEKVQKQLAAIVGANGVRVEVKAELNFDEIERTTETMSNPDNVLAQRQVDTETFTGTDPDVGGPLGPEDDNNVAVQGGTNNLDNNSTTEVFAPSKTTENTREAPGTVDRQTVSVILDSNAQAGVPIADIEQQVAAAAGINAARGDIVEVTEVPFSTVEADAAAAAAARADDYAARDQMLSTIRSVVTVVVVALGLLYGYRKLRGPVRTEELIPLEHLALASGADGEYGDDVLELDEEDYVEIEPAQVTVEGEEDVSTVLVSRRHRTELDRLPGMEERMAAHADISDLIDRQPDDVAQLLRSWMAEPRR